MKATLTSRTDTEDRVLVEFTLKEEDRTSPLLIPNDIDGSIHYSRDGDAIYVLFDGVWYDVIAGIPRWMRTVIEGFRPE